MSDQNDPRIFFAAERTLLAWIRTAIAVMGLGFVVARFGLFLRMAAAAARTSGEPHPHWESTVLGVAFVLLGVVTLVLASWQHRSFCSELAADELPRRNALNYSLWFAWILAALGLALSGWLVWSAGGG